MNPVPALLRSTILLIYSSHPISYQWWLWKERIALYPAQLSLQQAPTNNWSFVFRKSSLALELTGWSIKSHSDQNISRPAHSAAACCLATGLVSPGIGSNVVEFAWDSWMVLQVRALNAGGGHWPHSYQCGKERLITPGRAKVYARQQSTSHCNAQKSNFTVIASPLPVSQLQFTHYRYLSIFSGFIETWPGCA